MAQLLERAAPSGLGRQQGDDHGTLVLHPRRPGARRRVAVALAAAGLLAVLVAALLVGDAAPGPSTAGLPDAGAATGWGLPVAELATRLLAVMTIGHLVLAALLVPSRGQTRRTGQTVPMGKTAPTAPTGPTGPTAPVRAVRSACWTAVVWAVAQATVLLLTVSSLLATPVTRLPFADLPALLDQVAAGRAGVLTGALVATSAVLTAVAVSRRVTAGGTLRALALLALGAAVAAAVVPVVLSSHSAGAEGHTATVTSLAVHVVTASLWVGGLASLLLHSRWLVDPVAVVRRFSAVALVCVGLLLVSGIVGALLVVAGPQALTRPGLALSAVAGGYGLLLLVKTVLLVGLTAVGWWHRRVSLPALAAGRPGALLRLGIVEVAVMAATVAVAVALAASPPTGSTTPGESGGVSAAAGTQGTGQPDQSGQAAGEAAGEAAAGAADPAADVAEGPAADPADTMVGHDHGELSVAVLVDDERYHVGSAPRAGAPVTVYNGSNTEVSLTSDDGSFDRTVPPRTFVTFQAPAQPGEYPFGSSHSTDYRDVLVVRPSL